MPKAAAARHVQPPVPVPLNHSRDQSANDLPMFAAAQASAHDAHAALRSVPHSEDIIEYTMACILALAPTTSRDITEQVERQVRDIFAKNKIYIASRGSSGSKAPRNAQIKREFLAGERVAHLARKYSLTEQMVWIIVRDVR